MNPYFGITNITDAVLEDQIVENLIGFFDWNLLNVGAYFNVKRPTAKSKFGIASELNYATGRVWESKIPNGSWIWEVVSRTPPPINISGVYVNNVLTTTGYKINYKAGQIIFDSAKPSTTVVEAEYSHKLFNFYDSDNDWFQQVVFDPLPSSTLTDILSKNSVYLPAVIIEVIPGGRMTPYQIGDYSVLEDIPVLFHILSENDEDRNKIVHILKRMYDKTIWLFDINKLADADRFPIDSNGFLVTSPTPLTYPEIVSDFRWKRCEFANVVVQDITPQLPLFRAVVRATLRILMP